VGAIANQPIFIWIAEYVWIGPQRATGAFHDPDRAIHSAAKCNPFAAAGTLRAAGSSTVGRRDDSTDRRSDAIGAEQPC
jgi:hypothetical protein